MKNGVLGATLKIQPVVLLYALASVCLKWASGYLGEGWHEWANLWRLGGILGLVALLLGTYAFFWQKVIKGVPIGVAYANKSTSLLWAQLFAVTVFAEGVTGWNWAGMALVLCGVLLVNSGSAGGGRSAP